MGLSKNSANMNVAKRENSVIFLEENYEETYKNFDPNATESVMLLSLTQKAKIENSTILANLIQDQFKNRVGIKSRGCYETPGGTIYHKAHKAIESITLDREVMHMKEDVMNKYARLIYNGYWFSPERLALQSLIDNSQKNVNGVVRIKLFKGNVIVLGRKASKSLYSQDLSTFENDSGDYNQQDAEGFIKINSLRLRKK